MMMITRFAPSFRAAVPSVLVLSLTATILLSPSAGAAPARHATHAATAKFLVLTQAEVARVYGATFRPFMQIPYGKQTRAHGATTACGYSSGYAVMFANFRSSTPKGSAVASVMSTVFVYGDSACARSITRASSAMSTQYRRLKLHVSSLSGVGDGAFLMTGVQTTSGRTAYTTRVTFYRGDYTASLTVSSIGGKARLSDVMRLANTADQRIQKHG